MALYLSSAPATEPVSSTEAKLHLKIDADATDDALITALITAARDACETFTRRAFVTQTYQLFLDCFPSSSTIYLEKPPLQSVTHVKYYDQNGDLQTLSSALYQVDIKSEPGRIAPIYGETWPSTELGKLNAVEIQYVAGYGADSTVPAVIKTAIKMTLAELYENRQNTLSGTIVAELPYSVKWLLYPYRDLRFF